MTRILALSLAAVLLALPAPAAGVCAVRAGGVCVTRVERAAPDRRRAGRAGVRRGPVRVERTGRVIRVHNRPIQVENRPCAKARRAMPAGRTRAVGPALDYVPAGSQSLNPLPSWGRFVRP